LVPSLTEETLTEALLMTETETKAKEPEGIAPVVVMVNVVPDEAVPVPILTGVPIATTPVAAPGPGKGIVIDPPLAGEIANAKTKRYAISFLAIMTAPANLN
jgi:hypothetical protein